MSVSDAADLWRQFTALFEGQDVGFVSNAGAEFELLDISNIGDF